MANSASEEETGIELTDNGIDKLYQLYKKGDKKEILQLQVLDMKRCKCIIYDINILTSTAQNTSRGRQNSAEQHGSDRTGLPARRLF
jgi:hypothetical protein